MSISRFHAEWLSLLDISGPFLSLPVLVRRFPQGLEAHDPDHFRLLRQVHDEWDDNQQGLKPDPGIHTQWIKWVLKNTLELDEMLLEGQKIPQTLKAEIEEPQNRETLRPDLVLMDPDGKKARLLIQTYPLRQKLTRVVEGKSWKASPDTRMTQLLRDTGVTIGLVTNGEQWMLVYAPKGETSGYTSWYSTIWLEEQKTLAAFRNLLGLHRFFGVSDEETLEALLAESAEDQQEVTDQLGYQVRKAVEVLVQSLDKADQDYDGKLLDSVPDKVLYEASLTVMMRLVFLFCAEERELLLLGDELYDDNYAVSTLREQLRTTADNHGEEILERRNDAWGRLLTTFRAVYSGVQHERMKLPPYGGSLFNPDRFPFLEGREPKTSWQDTPSQPLPINNRTVLHLLEALQILQVRLPGGGPAEPRKLSFRALGIEQIGHVYEGLLDHTAIRAKETVLGLAGTRDNEPEIALSMLEELAVKSDKDLLAFLKKATGKSSISPVKKLLGATLDDVKTSRFRTVCHGDDELWQRIRSFAGLVRGDTFGYPVVITAGSVFVTAGLNRSATGTHYTPLGITEPIVAESLESLVYEGPSEGLPRSQWTLKEPQDLLSLDICDVACGSGAFLVQTCRYLSEMLVASWDQVIQRHGEDIRITPYGHTSKGTPDESIIPDSFEERIVYARRLVSTNCLYGVDQNSLACEMAKLSLWLLTLAKDKPFTFLDHAIRCGDSLIGIDRLDQLLRFSLDDLESHQMGFAHQAIRQRLAQTQTLRDEIHLLDDSSLEHVDRKEEMLADADEELRRLTCAADRLIAVYWSDLPKTKMRRELDDSAHDVELELQQIDLEKLDAKVKSLLRETGCPTPFHWPLEFPEVFDRGGFDAVLTNPPFVQGGTLSKSMRNVVTVCYESARVGKGPATSTKMNLVGLFSERMVALLKPGGVASFVCPKPLLRNERYWRTREVLLNHAVPQAVFDLPENSFASASVEPCALVIKKTDQYEQDHEFPVLRINDEPTKHIRLSDIQKDERYTIRIEASSDALELVNRLAEKCSKFADFFETKDGINPGRRDFRPVLLGTKQGDLFVPNGYADGVTNEWLQPEAFDSERHKPTINGRDFEAYSAIDWKEAYLRYYPEIAAIPEHFVKGTRWSAQLRERRLYDRPQKLVSRQTASTLIATIDDEQYFPLNNVHVHFPKTQECPYGVMCLLGIFNSSLLRFVYRSKSEETGKVFPQVHISATRALPIPHEPSRAAVKAVSDLVEEAINSPTDESIIRKIDRAVFGLYELTKSDVLIVEETMKDSDE
jgi:hypothetical protein